MSILLICGNNSLIVKDLMMKNQISLNIINSNYANISSTSELNSVERKYSKWGFGYKKERWNYFYNK